MCVIVIVIVTILLYGVLEKQERVQFKCIRQNALIKKIKEVNIQEHTENNNSLKNIHRKHIYSSTKQKQFGYNELKRKLRSTTTSNSQDIQ